MYYYWHNTIQYYWHYVLLLFGSTETQAFIGIIKESTINDATS